MSSGAQEVVCAVFSSPTLPHGFQVVSPATVPSGSAESRREKLFLVKVFTTEALSQGSSSSNSSRNKVKAFAGSVSFRLKPAAIRKLGEDEYLHKVLHVLQAGSGDEAGQSNLPAARKARNDFFVQLDEVLSASSSSSSASSSARLRITTRVGGIVFADIALRPMQVRVHVLVFGVLAVCGWV